MNRKFFQDMTIGEIAEMQRRERSGLREDDDSSIIAEAVKRIRQMIDGVKETCRRLQRLQRGDGKESLTVQ